MPFDFATLPTELASLVNIQERMRQQLKNTYGERQLTFFQKTHSTLWTKSLKAITALYTELADVTALAQFNRVFVRHYSPNLAFQNDIRFQESTSLNEIETFLKQLRRKANNGQDDLFVDIIHRLSQRYDKLSLAEKCAKNDDDRFAALIKHEALDKLRRHICFVALQTSMNPMDYYVVVVKWEIAGEPDSNKFIMSSPRGSKSPTTSISMLNKLKYDLLNQAQMNGNITLAQKKIIQDAAKINSDNELAQLKLLIPSLFEAPALLDTNSVAEIEYSALEEELDERNHAILS